jgi:hypothetical protein
MSASVSDGGCGKGTGMGRRRRRRDRAGARDTPERAGAGRSSVRIVIPMLRDGHRAGAAQAERGGERRAGSTSVTSRVPRAELGAPRVSWGAHSALAIAGTSSNTRRGGRGAAGCRRAHEAGAGERRRATVGGWGGRPWGGLRPFPAARLPLPSRRIRGPSGGGVNYSGGGVIMAPRRRKSWALREAGCVRTGRMSPSRESGTGQGDLTPPRPPLLGARAGWRGDRAGLPAHHWSRAKFSHRFAKRGRGEQRSRR